MPRFFAKFPPPNWRHDTRIYIKDVPCPKEDDEPIAAIICKNPGSAAPVGISSITSCGYYESEDDPTLKEIRDVFDLAIAEASKRGRTIAGQYIQVLNLDCWRHPDINLVAKHVRANPLRLFDPAESKQFPVIWAAWGTDNLNALKPRFLTKGGIWIYWDSSQVPPVVVGKPRIGSPARHPLPSASRKTAINKEEFAKELAKHL